MIDLIGRIENATATNYTYNITGDLILDILAPNGEKRLRGEHMYKRYIDFVRSKGSDSILGKCQVTLCEDDQFVANL